MLGRGPSGHSLVQPRLWTGAKPSDACRDLSPSNIILEGGTSDGRVLLVDFGGVQAAAAAADGPSFGSTTIVGTYGFMAPEQFRGQASPASDLYALGAITLFLASGAPLCQHPSGVCVQPLAQSCALHLVRQPSAPARDACTAEPPSTHVQHAHCHARLHRRLAA